MAEVTSINSQQCDCLNMNWERMVSVDMPKHMGKLREAGGGGEWSFPGTPTDYPIPNGQS